MRMDNTIYESTNMLEDQESQDTSVLHDIHTDNSPKKIWNVWEKKEAIITRERKIRRLTFANLPLEIAKVFDLNKGFFYTFDGLFTQPANIIRSFLGHDRDRVANPLKYLLIINGIILFLILKFNYFDFQAENFNDTGTALDGDRIELFNESINKYFLGFWNMWVIGSIISMGIFSYFFFKKTGFNLVEQMSINAYVYTQAYVFFIPFIVLELNSPKHVLIWVAIYLFYVTAVFTSLFKNSAIKTLLKVILINTLGILLFYLGFLVFAGTYLASGFITN